MVDQVESEPFSTAKSSQQTRFGSKLVQSPLPVMPIECVNERLGDFALIEKRRIQVELPQFELVARAQVCAASHVSLSIGHQVEVVTPEP